MNLAGRGARLLVPALATLALAGLARPGAAQFPQWSTFPNPYPDSRLVPPGVLRLGFLPSYANYSELFTGETGITRPLGTDLSADTTGSRLLPTLREAESAVAQIISDSSYRLNFGAARAQLDADVRRFPLDLQLGLASWLTVSLRVPLVRSRVQGTFRLDSTTSQAGWNQLAPDASNPQARTQIESLILQLDQGANTLESRIGAGDYGCPTSQQCAEARSLLTRTRRLADNLRRLSGVALPSGSPIPPVAPLASSAAGSAIRQEIAQVASLLQSFGAGSVTSTYPLPTTPWRTRDFTQMLQGTAYGYELLPLTTVLLTRLGDLEAGLAFGLLSTRHLHALLDARVRLPTGTRESPSHAFDLGTGDRQTDVELGLDAAAESSRLAVAFSARRIWQLKGQVALRWSSPTQPIAPRAFLLQTDRDLGDVFQLSAQPGIRLNEAIRAYASVYYFTKGKDSFSLAGERGPDDTPALTPPSPEEMSDGSAQRALHLGGGIYYRQDRRAEGVATLPIEAGLNYQTAFWGSARTPKTTVLHLYLRLYYRIWGRERPEG